MNGGKPAQMLAAAADLLEQGQLVNRMSTPLTAIAAAALLLPVFPLSAALAPLAALTVVAGLAELYLAARVGFDAALFRRLANDAMMDRLDLIAFDAGLAALRLTPPALAGRPIARRFMGARRLLHLQAAALAAQAALAILAAALTWLEVL